MNLEASWTSGFTYLTLDSVSRLTLSILLESCSRMRSLQTLHLITRFGANSPSPGGLLHHVNMPSLSALEINYPLNASLAFLDHIKPAPGCSLQLFTAKDGITLIEFVEAQRITAKFANNYFSQSCSTSLQLDVYPRALICVRDTRGFAVRILYSESATIPYSVFLLFLRIFEPAYMTGIKTLRLAVSSMLPLDNLSTDFKFLTVMTALEELYLSTSGLIHFINLLDSVNQQCSFPHLKTLIWAPIDVTENDSNITPLIVNFLATRRKIGMPIEILDLSNWLLGVPMDIKVLKEIPGLKVVWREDYEGKIQPREYVCWSGKHDR